MNSLSCFCGSLALVACLGAQAQGPAAVVAPVYPAGAGTALGAQIAALLADPAVARAHWGIAVTAMDGTPLWGLEEGKMFRPASNAKLFTTAAAMALLGPESTVNTVVEGELPDADGTVRGDVRLRSQGDTNLSGMVFPYVPVARETPASAMPLKAIDDLAAQMVAQGIRHISGKVVGDDTGWLWEPYPESWSVDDMVWGFGAPVSSLSVNDSTITLAVQGGTKPFETVSVTQSPDVGFYKVIVHATTTTRKQPKPIEIRRAIGSRVVEVWGEVGIGGKDVETLAVSDPPLFAAMALRSQLMAHGVEVDGEATAAERDAPSLVDGGFMQQVREPIPDLRIDTPRFKVVCTTSGGGACAQPKILARRSSPTLVQDVLYTMKQSQNLHAEQMLRRLGWMYGYEISGAQGARVVRQFLLNAKIDGNDFAFYDGSGLSAKDLVTPRATAQLLAYAATQPWFAQWKAALPVGGVDGTLASRFKEGPLKGHVYAKTGTLGESRALSGYVDAASGRTVIFSILVDDHAPGSSADRVVMDKIVAAIAAAN